MTLSVTTTLERGFDFVIIQASVGVCCPGKGGGGGGVISGNSHRCDIVIFTVITWRNEILFRVYIRGQFMSSNMTVTPSWIGCRRLRMRYPFQTPWRVKSSRNEQSYRVYMTSEWVLVPEWKRKNYESAFVIIWPQYESEAKCRVFIMKISFHSYANKTDFHMKTFTLILAFIRRFTATRKWLILNSTQFGLLRIIISPSVEGWTSVAWHSLHLAL